MTLQAVRKTVADYFGGTATVTKDSAGQDWQVYRSPKVAGIATLFLATPSDDVQDDYFQGLPAGTTVGVKAALMLGRKTSVRKAMGGDHDGIRYNHYAVTMQVFGLSAEPHGDVAQVDFDVVLDNIEAWLYQDRSLGTLTSDNILDAGEGPQGLIITPQETGAVTPDGRIYLYATVQFNVREGIHA